MSERLVPRPMTAAEFADWQAGQEELYELVDGQPLAMAGAKQRHDIVTVNAISEFRAALRGGPCRTFTQDLTVQIPAGNLRRPDVGIHCGPFEDDSTHASQPRLVLEVLSRSTKALDQVGKLDEYKTVESLDYILLVDPEAPEVIVWFRDAARAWEHKTFRGLDAAIELPKLDLTLRLADLYDGAALRLRPRLIGTAAEPSAT